MNGSVTAAPLAPAAAGKYAARKAMDAQRKAGNGSIEPPPPVPTGEEAVPVAAPAAHSADPPSTGRPDAPVTGGEVEASRPEAEALSVRVDRVENAVSVLRSDGDGLRTEVNGLHAKGDRLETKVDRLETKVDKLETKVDSLETKVDRLETKVDKLETKVDGLETKVDKLETTVDDLKTEVGGLKTRVDGIETKVDRLTIEVATLGVAVAGLQKEVAAQRQTMDKMLLFVSVGLLGVTLSGLVAIAVAIYLRL